VRLVRRRANTQYGLLDGLAYQGGRLHAMAHILP
jgi:hypothetical protein